MDRFSAMTVFVQVVEHGSFARAAQRLDISSTACSRYVADLEAHLGARLLNRTTRRLALTEAGEAFHQRAVQVLADLDEAEQLAGRAAVEARGTIRVTTTLYFGRQELAPAVAAFVERHPLVRFDIALSDRTVDLIEEGFDLAIRIGSRASESLAARPLGETRVIACASPAYLARHRAPRHPADLAAHQCLRYEYEATGSAWRFVDRAGRAHDVRVDGPVRSNNGELLVDLALAGAGITLTPDMIVAEALASGRLVQLLPDYGSQVLPIQALYPSRRHLSAKVRLFVDFLAARFAARAQPR
jgi:DNA-binding transcriptional LysR family regulator